jgi:hypothetical protein
MSRTLPELARSHGPSLNQEGLRHLNQIDLSRRWKLSPRTLERWRWLRQGPEYLKIGGRVVYRLEDVEAFETRQLRQPTSAVSNQ